MSGYHVLFLFYLLPVVLTKRADLDSKRSNHVQSAQYGA